MAQSPDIPESGPRPSDELKELYVKALDLTTEVLSLPRDEREGGLQQARALCRSFITLNPESADGLILLSSISFQLNELEEGERLLKQAQAVFEKEGKLDRVISTLAQLVQLTEYGLRHFGSLCTKVDELIQREGLTTQDVYDRAESLYWKPRATVLLAVPLAYYQIFLNRTPKTNENFLKRQDAELKSGTLHCALGFFLQGSYHLEKVAYHCFLKCDELVEGADHFESERNDQLIASFDLGQIALNNLLKINREDETKALFTAANFIGRFSAQIAMALKTEPYIDYVRHYITQLSDLPEPSMAIYFFNPQIFEDPQFDIFSWDRQFDLDRTIEIFGLTDRDNARGLIHYYAGVVFERAKEHQMAAEHYLIAGRSFECSSSPRAREGRAFTAFFKASHLGNEGTDVYENAKAGLARVIKRDDTAEN